LDFTMPEVTDLFPLDPYYPVEESAVDRKVRLLMESGKQHIRSKGTDLGVWELGGICTAAVRKTLIEFYELHATIGCTFKDRNYDPAEDHVVQFSARPSFQWVGYNLFRWSAQLVETTTA
jgi:hypothetical protein